MVIIDIFNKYRRNIFSGVDKKADELMSDIWFQTTPKIYLTYYLFILRNPDLLETIFEE